jgi:hypothetical protein
MVAALHPSATIACQTYSDSTFRGTDVQRHDSATCAGAVHRVKQGRGRHSGAAG